MEAPPRLAVEPRRRMLLAILAAGCGTLDQDDLSSYVEQLHSTAVEGALLAGQAARARVPISFVWIHSAELAHGVEELRSHLYGEVAPSAVKPYEFEARTIAEQISDALGALHSNPGERQATMSAQEQLDAAGREAESL